MINLKRLMKFVPVMALPFIIYTGYAQEDNKATVVFQAYEQIGASMSSRDIVHIYEISRGRKNDLIRPGSLLNPDFNPEGSLLLYSTIYGYGLHELYMIDLTSREIIKVTAGKGSAREIDGSFSPDGTQIVYTSTLDSGNLRDYDMYIVGTEGNMEPTLLLNDNGRIQSPCFSPDGEYIVFVSNADGNNELYVMESDGSNITQITETKGVMNINPDWADDGWIYFNANNEANRKDFDIYRIRPDGSDLEVVVDNMDIAKMPEVYDGQMVYVGSESIYNLWIETADGKEFSSDELPVLAADEWIYFVAGPANTFYRIKSDGTEIEMLSSYVAGSIELELEDGTYISLERTTQSQIYVMDLETKETKQVTEFNDRFFVSNPTWRPEYTPPEEDSVE